MSSRDGCGAERLHERPVTACFDSQDCVEGRRAFMGKRKPVFVGR